MPDNIQLVIFGYSFMRSFNLSLCFIAMALFGKPLAGQNIQLEEPVRMLALGDSYTIGESVEEKDRWPVQLINMLRKKGYDCEDPRIIATTGWRTDDLKRGIEISGLKKDFNLVSLLIGVNNQYQGRPVESYAPELDELIQIAISYAGGDSSKVFVVSIPDYGFTPFGADKKDEISREIDTYNAENKRISEKYGVRYFDITPISRKATEDPELIANDGLHPSAKMYSQWVEFMLRNW